MRFPAYIQNTTYYVSFINIFNIMFINVIIILILNTHVKFTQNNTYTPIKY